MPKVYRAFRIRRSLAFKLSLYIITCVVFTFMSVLIYNYIISKNTIIKDVRESTANLSAATLNSINVYLTAAREVPENLALMLEGTDCTDAEIHSLLQKVVAGNPEIYGSAIAWAPEMYRKGQRYFGPYYYKSGDSLRYADLGGTYNYPAWEWYIQPMLRKKGVWSEPYYDKGGGDILMVTYSVPFYRYREGKRVFSGVVTCDIALEWLIRLIGSMRIYESGYSFLISGSGAFIVHINPSYMMKETIFSLARNRDNLDLKNLGNKMTTGMSGFETYYSYSLGKPCRVYYSPLQNSGWSLGIVIPDDELFGDLKSMTIKLFSMGILGYVITLLLIVFLSNRITHPLRNLARATSVIGEGDFDADIPDIRSADEIGALSRSFLQMKQSLKSYILNLKDTTAAKEKIERELGIAREIQQSMLPKGIPGIGGSRLSAVLNPAREVGGDLYDFFFTGSRQLCIAIGDVSGKGVPAALYMAIARTLLRSRAATGADASRILTSMNQELCRDNDAAMFVTFFLGICNLDDGTFSWANAGHNPPVIIGSDGEAAFMDLTRNIPLGISPGFVFSGGQSRLSPGDTVVLYTDGITEAMDTANREYGDERMLALLKQNVRLTVDELSSKLAEDVQLHSGGAEQSDDITLLIFRYQGSENTSS